MTSPTLTSADLHTALIAAGVPATHMTDHGGAVEIDSTCLASVTRDGEVLVSGIDRHGNDILFPTADRAARRIAAVADREGLASIAACPRCGLSVKMTILAQRVPGHHDADHARCSMSDQPRAMIDSERS